VARTVLRDPELNLIRAKSLRFVLNVVLPPRPEERWILPIDQMRHVAGFRSHGRRVVQNNFFEHKPIIALPQSDSRNMIKKLIAVSY
jgi:hypothetical protein